MDARLDLLCGRIGDGWKVAARVITNATRPGISQIEMIAKLIVVYHEEANDGASRAEKLI